MKDESTTMSLMNKSPNEKLRILWHSVAPWIKSGYGKVTGNVLPRLAKHGFTVFASNYYGMEPGGILDYMGVHCLASKAGPFGIKSAGKYAKQYNTDVQILHTDWWAFSQFPDIMDCPMIYSPMDHIDYPKEILNFTRKYEKIISLCDWQVEELKKVNIPSIAIHHGLDTKVFNPRNKAECKKRLRLDGKFVVGTVAANSDKEDRKHHAGMIKGMYWFLKQNPDIKDVVWLYHTNPMDPRGMPLSKIADKWGLSNIIRFMDPNMADVMLSEEEMAQMYGAMDVHFIPSKREGFGIPIIESMACGIPNIGHDFSAPPEFIRGRGWLVKSVGVGLNYMTTPLNAETGYPDVYDIAEKLERAYFRTEEREKFGKLSAEYAKRFEWDNIVDNHWVPLLNTMVEEQKPVVLEDRLIE